MKGLYHKFRDFILPLFRKYSEYILYVFFNILPVILTDHIAIIRTDALSSFYHL